MAEYALGALGDPRLPERLQGHLGQLHGWGPDTLEGMIEAVDRLAPVGFYFGPRNGLVGWWLERRDCKACGRPNGLHHARCHNKRSQRRD